MNTVESQIIPDDYANIIELKALRRVNTARLFNGFRIGCEGLRVAQVPANTPTTNLYVVEIWIIPCPARPIPAVPRNKACFILSVSLPDQVFDFLRRITNTEIEVDSLKRVIGGFANLECVVYPCKVAV